MAIKKAAKKTAKKATKTAAARKTPAKKAAATASAEPEASVAKSAVKKVAPEEGREEGGHRHRREDGEEDGRQERPSPDLIDLDTPPESGKSLVIVESPAKAKTIGKYLGPGYRVKATVGHVRDLPAKKLGIDIENGFAPDYVTIEGKEKTSSPTSRARARSAREVFIATDPDREGEAIGWHVAQLLHAGPASGASRRPSGACSSTRSPRTPCKSSMDRPREIDSRTVDAQQARRVLDRLVGYKASPVLWKTVKKGLSAGRVQTVALRIIVEREREIRAFTPRGVLEHRGRPRARGRSRSPPSCTTMDGKKPEIGNRPTQADAHPRATSTGVNDASTSPTSSGASVARTREAPFKTSTLQQEAAKKLGFGSKRTMRLAQDLYEGIELGKAEGAVGLITYMRTDSRARLRGGGARGARAAARAVRRGVPRRRAAALSEHGKAQRAGRARRRASHRSVASPGGRAEVPHGRPVQALSRSSGSASWRRRWRRRCSTPPRWTSTIPRGGHEYLFRATGSVLKFAGFLALYREAREEGDGKALEDEQALPALEPGRAGAGAARSRPRSTSPSRRRASPRPRWSRSWKACGIGRPSTYASIISMLADRRYVDARTAALLPHAAGRDGGEGHGEAVPATSSTSASPPQMEGELDKIEEGNLDWHDVAAATSGSRSTRRSTTTTSTRSSREAHDLSALETERCPECGGKLVPKGGFFGPFVACENHPKACKYTRPIKGERSRPS